MTDKFAFGRTLCLLDENAQCIPIWVSQPHGLELVHFQTEITGREHAPLDAAYENCERQCLRVGHF